jgi:penicillin-binding protein 1A
MLKPDFFSWNLDNYKEFLKPNQQRLLWALIFAVPFALICITGLTTWFYFQSTLPSLSQLEQIEPRLITKIYDKDEELAHEFFVENRTWTTIDSTPEIVIQAVMAIEDREFYDHWGLNLWAMPGAIIESILKGKRLRGASTITQQLAKNLFLTPERSIIRKIKEAMTAVRIENTYTKTEILEFFLNQVYLGGGTYGFQSASDFYFGHSLDSITISEVATLAGLLQRPEGYRPDRYFESALKRRNTVLWAMRDAGYITKEQYKTALNDSLVIVQKETAPGAGGYFIEEVRKHLEKKYGENSLYAEGISVYTTLDQDLQAVAESVVKEKLIPVRQKLKRRHTHMLKLPKIFNLPADTVIKHFDSLYAIFDSLYLAKDTAKIDSLRTYPDSTRYNLAQAACIIIENKTGAIRAMVGGEDFSKSKFNRATMSVRQPGSAFKAFVYAVAMDNGGSPADSVNDQPITIPDPLNPGQFWRPNNYEKKFDGYMSYREALYKSKNLPAIQIGMKYGLGNLVNYSRNFGLKSQLSAVPSLAIGSIGATLMEMTSGYSVFPNLGTRIEPYLIENIQGRSGETIEKNFKVEHEVLRKPSAYLMISMLQDVNIRGTAARIWGSGFHHPSGGKTGTTNDYTDAWYIGFTSEYTMGVWVGTDAHVPMGYGHTGTEDALPIWLDVMKYAHKDLKGERFPIPSGVVSKTICSITGKVAGNFCGKTYYGLYSYGNHPEEECDGNHVVLKPDKKEATLFENKKGVESDDTTRTRLRKTF